MENEILNGDSVHLRKKKVNKHSDEVMHENAEIDPFNPKRLRLDQNFGADLRVKELVLKVPVRKAPSKEWFVRVRPGAEHRLSTMFIDLRDDREELFQVAPELWPALVDEPTFRRKLAVTAINTLGTLFVWHVRVPGPDGRSDDWMDSALDAIREAESKWVKVFAGPAYYRVQHAEGYSAEPDWPDMDLAAILDIAFKDHRITSLDHPVIRRLRGQS